MTTKTTKSSKSSKSTKSAAKAIRAKATSAFHTLVFKKPTTKRCLHKSEDGKKVCSRFHGHKVAHFYVPAKELKAKVEAWRERYVTA